MLARARSIAHTHHPSATNISFVHSRLTAIPLPTDTVDCLISNCVINLVPDVEKPTAFREMFRLLKPGGRVAVSDILLKDGKVLPDNFKRDVGLYVGCVAGASWKGDYERWLKEAGFKGASSVAQCRWCSGREDALHVTDEGFKKNRY